MNSETTQQFHRQALRNTLDFLAQQGIRQSEQLKQVKGDMLLGTSLWKLLELDGKYGGDHISEGVLAVEQRLNEQVGRTYGTWSTRALKILGPAPQNLNSWSKSEDYSCNLEHVVEKRHLIAELLNRPQDIDTILNSLIGCVVLKSEHARLKRLPTFEPQDPWKRYREASPKPIKVWSRLKKDWLDLSSR